MSSKCEILFSDNSQSENIMKLKRRFLKDKSGTNVFYAKMEMKRKKLRQVLSKLGPFHMGKNCPCMLQGYPIPRGLSYPLRVILSLEGYPVPKGLSYP